ncbi:ABC transporter ATP-binding protein [Streptomyces fulvoviolaceus]|uniref:ABC transporter ATP-binding protein n=1 Tax=Streptomyces fulvoviolaceus TaxID=285535 RepID=UPI0004C9B628|nr:ABC transporter ATP-binding protein [Streptomyces fulvoviolaceus]
MLEVRDVVAGYGNGTVLHGLSLSVQRGEIVGILGRNGMGKTSLIRAVAGLLRLREGTVRLDDIDLSRAPAHARAQHGIAVVPQGRGVFPDLTVDENLKLGRMAAGKRSRPGRLGEVLDYFPRLGERGSQAAGTLSGGEQQMLAIGRALMSEPQLLLLDEPSDGIMPVLVQQIAQNIVDINRNEGLTTVVVEQNVPMVRSMAGRCLLLEGGQVIAEGLLDALADSGRLEQHLGV